MEGIRGRNDEEMIRWDSLPTVGPSERTGQITPSFSRAPLCLQRSVWIGGGRREVLVGDN